MRQAAVKKTPAKHIPAKAAPARKAAPKKPAAGKPSGGSKLRKNFKASRPAPAQKPPMFPPLCRAAMDGDLAEVKRLLDAGGDIEEKDNNHRGTPLLLAIGHGHADVAFELMARGANVKAQEDDGGTAIISAAANNLVDLGRKLLEKGADPRTRIQDARFNMSAFSVSQEFEDMLAAFKAEQKAAAEARKQAKAESFSEALQNSVVLQNKISIRRPLVLKFH